jgi:hypothetical protein
MRFSALALVLGLASTLLAFGDATALRERTAGSVTIAGSLDVSAVSPIEPPPSVAEIARRVGSSLPAERITPDRVMTRSGAAPSATRPGVDLEELSLPSVTYEEVEAAMAAYLECADANGYITHPWPGEGLRLTRPFLTIPGTADLEEEEQGEAVRAAHKTLTECQREYLDDALTAWNAQMIPSDEERLEIFAFMERCIQEGGRPGTERPAGMGYSGYTSGPQLDFLIRADQLAMWADCAWALETETGFRAPPPPGGG